MISIDVLRQLNTANHYMITEHARIRLFERNITIDDVICCVDNGKIIEQYENDKPFPSCLILGVELKGKYIHVKAIPSNRNQCQKIHQIIPCPI